MKTKIGKMPYLNSEIFYLKESDIFKYEIYTPRKMGIAFNDGCIKSGPLSLVDYFESQDAIPLENYCVSTKRKAKSVLLFSDLDIDEISNVYVTDETSTSVNLMKALNNFYWKNPKLKINQNMNEKSSVLLIGDSALRTQYAKTNQYKNIIDLGEEWNKYTSLPFVFAVWAYKELNNLEKNTLINDINKGISNIKESIEEIALKRADSFMNHSEISDYLNGFTYKISDNENKAIKLFKEMYNEIKKK